MGLLRVSLVVAIIAGVIAYFVYIPLPAEIDQPGQVRIITVSLKVLNSLEWLMRPLLGFQNHIEYLRIVTKLFASPPDLDAVPDIEVTNHIFNGVSVRIYRSNNAPKLSPAIINFHGGGWSLGSVDTDDRAACYLARQVKITVISVEYRLSPENPFPIPLEDCLTVTVHVLTHGGDLGLDVNKVGIMGLSAGGNLAAAVSLRLQAPEFNDLPKVRLQVLLMPTLQGVDMQLPSILKNDQITGGILSQKAMAEFLLSYAGLDFSIPSVQQVVDNRHLRPATRAKLSKYINRDILDKVDQQQDGGTTIKVNETFVAAAEPIFLNPYFSPLLAAEETLRQVPPAFIAISRYDVLHDDSVLYSHRLQQAGVPVTSHFLKNGHHMSMCILKDSTPSGEPFEAYNRLFEFLNKHFGT